MPDDNWTRLPPYMRLGAVTRFEGSGGEKRAPSVFEDLLGRFAGLRDIAAFAAPQPSRMDHVGLALRTGPDLDLTAFWALKAAQFGANFPAHRLFVDVIDPRLRPCCRGGGGDPCDLRSFGVATLAAVDRVLTGLRGAGKVSLPSCQGFA